jgi:hypothetical protein
MRKGKKYFAVHYKKTHCKHMSLPCVGNNVHGKVLLKELYFVYSECARGEKYFAVRYKKLQGKLDLRRAFFQAHGKKAICRAPEIERTSKILTHGKHGFSRSVSWTKLMLMCVYR